VEKCEDNTWMRARPGPRLAGLYGNARRVCCMCAGRQRADAGSRWLDGVGLLEVGLRNCCIRGKPEGVVGVHNKLDIVRKRVSTQKFVLTYIYRSWVYHHVRIHNPHELKNMLRGVGSPPI